MSGSDYTRPERDSSTRPSPEPFAIGCRYYVRAGWPDLIPIRRGGPKDKQPRVPGYHGRNRKRVSDKTLYGWARQFGKANIALALPRNVLGLDVDHYGTKRGGDTLRELESELGPLPLTPITTSRWPDDKVSGIRLFRLPDEYLNMNWPAMAGDGIDIICWYERYAIVPPSVHISGRSYRWVQNGGPVRGMVSPDSLSMLPVLWCEYLADKPRATGNGRFSEVDSDFAGTLDWLDEYGSGEMCGYMEEVAPKWLAAVSGGSAGSAYDAMKNATATGVRATAEGHRGLNEALRPVRAAYISRVGSRPRGGRGERYRPEQVAVEEWRRCLDGAVRLWGGHVADTDEVCDELEGF